MSALKTHLRRLFLCDDALVDAAGRTRALVLELPAPTDAAALSAAWRAMPDELGWPAPAIALSGEGLQLWTALAEPLDLPAAAALAGTLSQRLWPGLPERSHRAWPQDGRHTALPGAVLDDGERWTAFIAADLAPLFSDTPWLDIPPRDDGQAALLAAQSCVTPAQLAALQTAPAPAAAPAAAEDDPRRFLRQVMNDTTVPLALRIEAAKALLLDRPAR